jgi:Arc/MetJ-type ribon-helix-helix transcriptional regulator
MVLPIGLLRETTRLLDGAVKAGGFKSRSAFIRTALIEKLRAIGGDEAVAAADALAGEAG